MRVENKAPARATAGHTKNRSEAAPLAPVEPAEGNAALEARLDLDAALEARLDLDAALEYTLQAAAKLGLGDWDISVGYDGSLDDACAQVEAPPYQRRARIVLGPPFLQEDAAGKRDTVVHELVHLIVMGSWKFVDELLDQEMGARAARIAWLGYVSHMESHVDHLAGLLSPAVPLPPEMLLP